MVDSQAHLLNRNNEVTLCDYVDYLQSFSLYEIDINDYPHVSDEEIVYVLSAIVGAQK
jgi:hypothetical protein